MPEKQYWQLVSVFKVFQEENLVLDGVRKHIAVVMTAVDIGFRKAVSPVVVAENDVSARVEILRKVNITPHMLAHPVNDHNDAFRVFDFVEKITIKFSAVKTFEFKILHFPVSAKRCRPPSVANLLKTFYLLYHILKGLKRLNRKYLNKRVYSPKKFAKSQNLRYTEIA